MKRKGAPGTPSLLSNDPLNVADPPFNSKRTKNAKIKTGCRLVQQLLMDASKRTPMPHYSFVVRQVLIKETLRAGYPCLIQGLTP